MKLTAFSLFVYTACISFITWHYTSTYDRINKPETIKISTLEQRIFEQYGEGDAGVEEMLYLTTGIRQDFMGNPVDVDYFVNITDSGTQIYTMQGKFVDFVPFDSTSQFDRAILADNL